MSRSGSHLYCSSWRWGPLWRQRTSIPPPRSSTWWLSTRRITRSMRTSPHTPWRPTHPGNPRSTHVRKRHRSTGSRRPCSSGIRTHRIHSESIGCSPTPATRITTTQPSSAHATAVSWTSSPVSTLSHRPTPASSAANRARGSGIQ